jgi:hypothetical protein
VNGLKVVLGGRQSTGSPLFCGNLLLLLLQVNEARSSIEAQHTAGVAIFGHSLSLAKLLLHTWTEKDCHNKTGKGSTAGWKRQVYETLLWLETLPVKPF